MALIYRSWRLANGDSLQDDEADVAMRGGAVAMQGEESELDSADTEFGTRAQAAVSTARDLEESDEQAAADLASSENDDAEAQR
jgi:multicomponent Na+:H+ antiporter subunit C